MDGTEDVLPDQLPQALGAGCSRSARDGGGLIAGPERVSSATRHPAPSAAGLRAYTCPRLWAVPVKAGPGARRATARSVATRSPTHPVRSPAQAGAVQPPCWGRTRPKTGTAFRQEL